MVKANKSSQIFDYGQYLRDNIGNLPMEVCLEIMERAESGDLSDLEVQEMLAPVIGDIFFTLHHQNAEGFQTLLKTVKDTFKGLAKEKKFIDFGIDVDRVDTALRFEKLAEFIRKGWEIERVDDNTDNDNHVYFVLARPEGNDQHATNR